MKTKDIFAVADQFKNIKGIEGTLRRRRLNGMLATVFTILLGLFEVMREIIKEQSVSNYLSNVGESSIRALKYLVLNVSHLVSGQWDSMIKASIDVNVLGFYVIVIGIIIYYLSRHTAFLLTQSREPFHYTFWIARFVRAEDSNTNDAAINENDQVHHFLHHDLMEKLNRRIGRFSLLDEQNFMKKDSNSDESPPSHIHVDGHYSFRKREHNGTQVRVIQIMPRVRIGPPGNPSILTHPVEIELPEENAFQPSEKFTSNDSRQSSSQNIVLDLDLEPNLDIYEQVVEQVYSKVASEIYKQLKSDIENKLHLFPTRYLRTVALYYEAEDFARSSTIDSYDYAIDLFQKALRYYDISFRPALGNVLNHARYLRFGIDYELMHARIRIEYAKSLIYRRLISSFYGRAREPLYSAPMDLKKVADRLVRIHNKFHLFQHKVIFIKPDANHYQGLRKARKKNRMRLLKTSLVYGKDSWIDKHLRRKLDSSKFRECQQLLFETHVVLSLAYADLDAFKEAETGLEDAKASFPEQCDKNALFLLTKAQAKPDIESRIPLLIQSTELNPNFEIAQYLLAKCSLQRFLLKGEIEAERAESVVQKFRKVLRVNPGNIAAHADLGYLYWLIDDLEHAQKQFTQGIDIKAIAQQAFIGELNYGLARLAARHGHINRCYHLYSESLSSEPGMGAYSNELVAHKKQADSFYDYISPAVLDRYSDFRDRFKNQIHVVFALIDEKELLDPRTLSEALDQDKYKITNYIRKKLEKSEKSNLSGINVKETARGFSVKTLTRHLNWLLQDPGFSEYLVNQDNALQPDIERFKKKVSFEGNDEGERNTAIIRLNRFLLGLIYPRWIAPYDDGAYFTTLGKALKENKKFSNSFAFKKGLCDSRGNPISFKTINRTYSFVLNDHGNACLNYYHRFGGDRCLKQAIEAYETAIKLNPDNPIAYYNIENAEMWREYFRLKNGSPENEKRSARSLKKRVKYMKNAARLMDWSMVTIKLANLQMEKSWNEISKLEQEIESYKIKQIRLRELQQDKQNMRKMEDKLKGLENKLKGLEENLQFEGRKPEMEDLQEMAVHPKLADLRSKIKNLDQEISQKCKKIGNKAYIKKEPHEIEIEIRDLPNLISGRTEDLKEKKRENIENVRNPAMEKTIRLSNLSALIEGYDNIVYGDDIKKLKKIKIPSDKLEERDIEALINWSKLLLSSEPDRSGLEASVKLLNFASRLLPNSLDVHIALLDAYWGLERLEESRGPLFPFFNKRDIKTPRRLLAGIKIKRKYLVPEELTKAFDQIPRKWLFSDNELCTKLVEFLNFLVKTRFFDEKLLDCDTCLPRTYELIKLEKQNKFSGTDLYRFNRRILEEVFPEEIVKSKVEIAQDSLDSSVKDWLIDDQVHFLVHKDWAPAFLTLPERKLALEKAIRLAPPSVRKLRKMLEKTNEEKNKNLENERDELVKEIDSLINEGNWETAEAWYKKLAEAFPDYKDLSRLRDSIDEGIQRHRIKTYYGEKWSDQLLVVTPLAMEVAGNLIPEVEGEGDKLNPVVGQLVIDMQNRIEKDFGVKVPGIRFRGNEEDLSDGAYVILCNEIPVALGQVPVGKKLFTGEPAVLERLKIGSQDKTSDPVTGDPGFWIDEEDVSNIDEKNQQYIETTMKYPIRQLEAVLQRNLVEFLGNQEVHYLIDQQCHEKLNHYDETPLDLARLSTVLRALIGDKVPITAFPEILACFEANKDNDSNTTNLINKVRLIPKVNRLLPGIGKDNYFKLSPEIEQVFRNASHRENGHVILAMQPETVQDVSSAVRNAVVNGENAAIIVEDGQLRPLVGQLFRMESPDLPVTTEQEMQLKPPPENSVTTIYLES